MRRVGCAALVLLALVVAAWLALLVYGGRPAAPGGGPGPVRLGVLPAQPAVPAPAGLLGVPVAGIERGMIADSWGDPRDNGLRAHHGTDVIAASGMPVVAAAPGTIEKIWTSAAGGLTLYVRSPARDWTYYYAHLSGYAPGLREGMAVRTGDPLGFVGDTGNAGAGNYHLHFGLTRTTPDQHWYQGRDVDPYPYLTGKPARYGAP